MRPARFTVLAVSLSALMGAGAAPTQAATPKASEWIDISISHISAPEAGATDCTVKGWVVTVRDGARYQPGSAILLSVPCATAGVQGGDVSGSALAADGKSKNASVKLDSMGKVIAYTPFDTATDPTK
jgi:hypothetical protein